MVALRRRLPSRARSSPSARPIPLDGLRPRVAARRHALAHTTRDAIGRLYKVLPTALVAAALRPSIDARASSRRARRRARRHAAGRGRQHRRRDGAARRSTTRRRAARGTRHHRPSNAAGASASATGTSCATTPGRSSTCCARRAPPGPTDARRRSRRLLPHPRRQPGAQAPRVPLRHAPAPTASPGASSPARRSRKPSPRRAHRRRGPDAHARPARRERGQRSTRPRRHPRLRRRSSTPSSPAGIERNISLKLTQLGLDLDRAHSVDNLRRILDAGRAARASSCASTWRTRPYTDVTLEIFETMWQQGLPQRRHRAAVVPAPQRAGPRRRERARRARAAGEGRLQGAEARSRTRARPTSTRRSCG